MFQSYGKLAQFGVPDTIQNGRYLSQQEAEKLIPADIIKKLEITGTDQVLDIGCGSGVIARELAGVAKAVTGCDHPVVIKNALKNELPANLNLLGEDFFEFPSENKFEKIVLYGVIQTLPDISSVHSFLDKAISLLKKEGRFLIGDIPNQDKKKRFLNSEYGKRFQKEWEKNQTSEEPNSDLDFFYRHDSKVVDFNDQVVANLLLHIRKAGLHAYLLDQPQSLPFGNTREDILVVGPEYEQARAAATK